MRVDRVPGTRPRHACALLLLGLVACGGDGGTGPETTDPPTIDGVRTPGEWSGATVIPITGPLIAGGGESTVLVTTDGVDLFIALEITDPTEDSNDSFSVRFDNDNDDLRTDGDDAVSILRSGTFFDSHFDAAASSYAADPGAVDGRGAVGQEEDTAFYELSHPLDSGEPGDIAVRVGDTVGLCFRYGDAGTTNSGQPAECVLSVNEQERYVDVTLSLP